MMRGCSLRWGASSSYFVNSSCNQLQPRASVFARAGTVRMFRTSSDGKTRIYSREEVAVHDNEDSLWVVVNRRVLDLTKWINLHPGGRDILLQHAGKDGSKIFEEIGHSEYAKRRFEDFVVGEVEEDIRYGGDEYHEREGEV